MELTKQQIADIAYTAGWNTIGGFVQTSYRYVAPNGNYAVDLPDYNKDKTRLKIDLEYIQKRIKHFNDLETLCHQALN